MLIKKELESIPLLKFPKITAKERKDFCYSAAAQLHTLDKCGTVLVVDIFDTKSKELKLRFFSDCNTFLICDKWPAEKWFTKKPESFLHSNQVASLAKDDDMVKAFLKDGLVSWYYGHSVINHINGFVSAIYSKKQEQAMDRKYEKRVEHFAMYPDYPADLPLFCDRHVFKHTYIFIEKAINGKRQAVCGHCQHKFTVISTESKPGQFCKCPKCGMKAKYRGEWVAASPIDKAKICIAHKADGQLILRWVELERTYSGTKYCYRFDDYYRNLYIRTPEGNAIYSYRLFNNMGLGWNWFRRKNGTVNYEKTYIYTGNLNEVFGDSYYHVDLQAGMDNVREIVFPRLLDNLKNNRAAEYLFKMGLTSLTANLHANDLAEGNGFAEVMGVSRQYLPLYRNFNIDINEHRIIQASKTWVSAENFQKFRDLNPESVDTNDIMDILDDMSFEKFVNYFEKQKNIIKRKLGFLLMQYKDYINMAQALKTDLSRKSVRFPKNIKEAHDLILPRFNEVKHEVENENFKQAIEKIYAGMSEYAKGIYCVVFPKLRSDFITEGQSLNHCVGADSYYQNHIKGTKMVFFVRKVEEPEKPFYTMEINMKQLKISQLYGFGGNSPPAEVRKFANDFLRRLKPAA